MGKRVPAEVFHPWEYIEEEMTERGWDRDELARRMGGEFPVTRLSLDLFSIKDPSVMLGEDSAEQLSRAFGTSAKFWMNVWAAWSERNPPTPPQPAKGEEEKSTPGGAR